MNENRRYNAEDMRSSTGKPDSERRCSIIQAGDTLGDYIGFSAIQVAMLADERAIFDPIIQIPHPYATGIE